MPNPIVPAPITAEKLAGVFMFFLRSIHYTNMVPHHYFVDSRDDFPSRGTCTSHRQGELRTGQIGSMIGYAGRHMAWCTCWTGSVRGRPASPSFSAALATAIATAAETARRSSTGGS